MSKVICPRLPILHILQQNPTLLYYANCSNILVSYITCIAASPCSSILRVGQQPPCSPIPFVCIAATPALLYYLYCRNALLSYTLCIVATLCSTIRHALQQHALALIYYLHCIKAFLSLTICIAATPCCPTWSKTRRCATLSPPPPILFPDLKQ